MIRQAPMVSVCIPTYCGSATIGAAIESVLGQKFSDFELIVVDDGSTDETRSIVRSYSDDRLRYFRNSMNLGPQGNWNRCLELSNGKYFKLLPHDDVLAAECLECQISILEKDQEEKISLVFSARNVLSPEGRILMRRSYPGGQEGYISGLDVIRACIRYGTNLIGEPGAVLFRKSLSNSVGGFNATNPYVIDLDYWFRLLANGGGAYYLPDPLAGFRVSSSSWSVKIGSNQSSDFIDFISRIPPEVKGSVGRFDLACGKFMPILNNLARAMFYRIHLR